MSSTSSTSVHSSSAPSGYLLVRTSCAPNRDWEVSFFFCLWWGSLGRGSKSKHPRATRLGCVCLCVCGYFKKSPVVPAKNFKLTPPFLQHQRTAELDCAVQKLGAKVDSLSSSVRALQIDVQALKGDMERMEEGMRRMRRVAGMGTVVCRGGQQRGLLILGTVLPILLYRKIVYKKALFKLIYSRVRVRFIFFHGGFDHPFDSF